MTALPRIFGASLVLAFLALISTPVLYGQEIHHWESIVLDDDNWRYLAPTSEPAPSWRALTYDDTSWPEGPGGFGYGDEDDQTVLEDAQSVFTRISFSVVDTNIVAAAILHVDYDDAYVAFLNDVEIARAGIGVPGDRPAFDQFANSLHEAQLYQGGNPSGILLTNEQLSTLLQEGSNVLAIQVHNDNANSSDLTSRAFFSVGLLEAGNFYRPTPAWFVPPITTPEEITSTLPLMVIDIPGQIIPDEPKIIGHMGIIDNGVGELNSISDPFTDYDGFIGIERRGSSSQSFPKLSYAIETRDVNFEDMDASLLGLPEEEDWVLHGPYSDKSLMRNVLVFHLANRMGRYASRTRFVELVLNNDYQGIYVLMEKIKRDKNRVNVSKLNSDEVSGDDLTGGYIIKIDKSSGTEVDGWQSPHAPKPGFTQRVFYQYHYPKPSNIVPAQKAYIQNVVSAFEDAMSRANYADPEEGYAKYIDVDSAVDFYLLNEIARNVDGYRLSTFLHKEKDSEGHGKLVFGPLWDFNLGFGNADYYNGGLNTGFQAATSIPEFDPFQPPFWWEKLWKEPSFNARVVTRWESLRQSTLHQDSILQFIDANVSYLEDAPVRNFNKWNILGSYVWPNVFIGNTYSQEIDFFKGWITDRLEWIDENLSSVALPTLPSLPRTTFELSAVYPNPLEREASVTLMVGRQQSVRIEIYDMTGRLVSVPFEGIVFANTVQIFTFSRISLASGVYLLRAIGVETVESKKLVVR